MPARRVHFIGIGGIGMSGLALLALHQNYRVSGCDQGCTHGRVYDLLIKNDIAPVQGHDPSHLDDGIDIVVYSSAISAEHPEMLHAKKLHLKMMHRAQFLKVLTDTHTHRIAISGAHGKTTTTALTSAMFAAAGLNPTVYVGGICTNFSSNVRLGGSKYFIFEADESDGSFLHFNPTMSVVTNVDAEHLETYGSFDGVKNSFRRFCSEPSKKVICVDDDHARMLLRKGAQGLITYGLNPSYNPHVSATDVIFHPSQTTCTLLIHGEKQAVICLPIPGKHNLLNALAAVAIGHGHDLSPEVMAKGLATFAGVARRFEFKGSVRGTEVFDDYAHHPVEIEVAICTAKKRAKGRLIVVFQPHKYSRTKDLWTDFVTLLARGLQDRLYVMDIYAAGQADDHTISSQRLVSEIKKFNQNRIEYSSSFDAIEKQLLMTIKEGDLVLTVGAGDVYKIGENLL